LVTVCKLFPTLKTSHIFLQRFIAAVQDTLPADDSGENTLANNQILYPLCIKCLEKFENNPEQIHNKDFAEICLLIVSFLRSI
jgi:hypothetical protein